MTSRQLISPLVAFACENELDLDGEEPPIVGWVGRNVGVGWLGI